MIPLVGKNFDVVTRTRSIGIAIGSTNYARSLKGVGLPSFLRRMMKFTTTLLFCETFFWGEPPREAHALHRLASDIVDDRYLAHNFHIREQYPA